MSASLVGSEMCIRDRLYSAAATWARPRGATAHPEVDNRPHVSSNSFPVSYTHLTLPTICSV
eukprot:10588038-Alexandrium_andersonii.AAC.1